MKMASRRQSGGRLPTGKLICWKKECGKQSQGRSDKYMCRAHFREWEKRHQQLLRESRQPGIDADGAATSPALGKRTKRAESGKSSSATYAPNDEEPTLPLNSEGATEKESRNSDAAEGDQAFDESDTKESGGGDGKLQNMGGQVPSAGPTGMSPGGPTNRKLSGDVVADEDVNLNHPADDSRQRKHLANTHVENIGRYTYIRNVCLTRKDKDQSFGLVLQSPDEKTRGSNIGCEVKEITKDASAPPDLFQQGDLVISINGQDPSKWTYEKTVKELRSTTALTLMLSLRRDRLKATKTSNSKGEATRRSGCKSSNCKGEAASTCTDEADAASIPAHSAEAAPTTGTSAEPFHRTGDVKDGQDASEANVLHLPSVENLAEKGNGANRRTSGRRAEPSTASPARKRKRSLTEPMKQDPSPSRKINLSSASSALQSQTPLSPSASSTPSEASTYVEFAEKLSTVHFLNVRGPCTPGRVSNQPPSLRENRKCRYSGMAHGGPPEITTTHPPSVANPAKRENGAKSKSTNDMPEYTAGPEEGGDMSNGEDATKEKGDAKLTEPPEKKRRLTKNVPVEPFESAVINASKKQASNNLEPTPQDLEGPQIRFVFKSNEENEVLAEIFLDDRKVGFIRAQYIKREVNFCEKCERVGGDLEEVAADLFGEGGKIHCNDLKSFECCWQEPDDCYFLFIQQIDVQEEFESYEKRSDVISSLIKLFLTDKRMKKWKIVAYRANDGPQPGEHPFVRSKYGLLNQEEYAENKWTAWETERRECIGSDSRPFLRVGFQELSKESTEEMGFLYVTKKMFSQTGNDRMSFAKAAQIKLRCDDPPDVEEYRKEKLQFKLLATILEEDRQLELENHKPQYDDSSFVERVLPRIDELIAKGADVGESKALHAAAYQFFAGLFLPLLNRGGEIDSRDKNSMTPLMVVVGSNVDKRIENNIIRSQLAISTLCEMGADKNLRDRAGRTALGHYYQTMKDLNDLERSQIGVPDTPIDNTLERLLMPDGGPTEADMRARDGA
mmetsp:Transcript_30303/g.67156  ORF Transcript_30303/g.67156 Transcript_30303/m.67156 type:complete len:1016 (+) Transcript_30303:476-3523(+)